ncbi:MAG: hypothetical protein HC840_29830 [Leptolyngbyaceae cyanobacterium RM2_2_4]|nr:hypothetical protein [Leptolyngbyaceae cyanobacterium SM1_4_3]NJO52898.1 hypothetical protein [Leptolyngbyaceae cyanobacterium RM2_2_4]
MNLQQEISTSLYQIVQDKYENGLYRDAILAATFYLEKVILDQSNCTKEEIRHTGLGRLIMQVFGSPEPVIQINRMLTVAEVYEQKGLEQTLLGLHQFITFSRIHSDFSDNQKTADAIIIFVNYLISRIQNRYRTDLNNPVLG